MTSITECIDRVQKALEKSGRQEAASDITIVVASKSQSASRILEVVEELESLKVRFVLGENYVQEWEKKRHPSLLSYPCHLIGHLQSNKAKKASTLFACIETVDDLSLAKKLTLPEFFIQCNVSCDNEKQGVLPEGLIPLVTSIKESNLQSTCTGLMTITHHYATKESVRSDFRAMRRWLSEMEIIFNRKMSLSMGMSQDYEVAIEEGATHIRLGTALFGSRE